MATEKERSLMIEIMDLADGVNADGKVNARVEMWSAGFQLMMSARPYNEENDWVYYPDRVAYFSDDVFSEENFEFVASTYIAELKKHHPQYDADGVRV